MQAMSVPRTHAPRRDVIAQHYPAPCIARSVSLTAFLSLRALLYLPTLSWQQQSPNRFVVALAWSRDGSLRSRWVEIGSGIKREDDHSLARYSADICV